MSSSTSSVTLCVKWGKETLKVESFAPSSGASSLLQQLSDRTNVPLDRVKLLSKSKGLWKGVLTANTDLSSLDWETASKNGGEIQVLLMGSASQVVAPPASARTVFLEDLPPEEAAAIVEPSGLANLGNTCYLNSVVQCLRAVEPLRRGLEQFATISAAATTSNSATSNNNGGVSKLLISSLQDTLRRLDRQATAVEPAMLVQATRVNFPQFAQRGPHGHPQQQDAEEFYSNLLTVVSGETRGNQHIEAGLGGPVTSDELKGASNLVDAVFGIKMEETLTCDEVSDASMEPPVVAFDLHRKLVCNIQGGSDGGSSTASDINVTHIAQGIQLSLNGKIEKHSDALGRNAIWTRQQCIARLPPILAVQFGRFYWKATPDSQDHAGVKCKVMKPVAFTNILDVYEFCNKEVQGTLKVARDKALADEEDRINKKLKGEEEKDDENKDADAMETSQEVDTADPDLQAALAMSMETQLTPVGPGLPDNFQGLYELFAVVTHKGRDADGGHYMAWVKANNSKSGPVEKIADTNVENEDWFVFDDDEVSPCKTEDVLKLKGGGDWHMSYLNFYRAKK